MPLSGGAKRKRKHMRGRGFFDGFAKGFTDVFTAPIRLGSQALNAVGLKPSQAANLAGQFGVPGASQAGNVLGAFGMGRKKKRAKKMRGRGPATAGVRVIKV